MIFLESIQEMHRTQHCQESFSEESRQSDSPKEHRSMVGKLLFFVKKVGPVCAKISRAPEILVPKSPVPQIPF
jgi:hypothetical protein